MEEVASTLDKRKKSTKGIIVEDAKIQPNLIGVAPKTDSTDEKNRIKYNADILNMLPEYKEFVPTGKVVVRCFVMEYYKKNGVLQIPEIEVPVKTSNGYAVEYITNSPYPFSRRAVVVAVPEGMETYKPGDHVLLPTHVILATKINKNAPFHLPKAFTMDTWLGTEPPTNMLDPHYGYLLLEPRSEILGKLKKQ